jgi:DmsE family decaheme c-type cytochrome
MRLAILAASAILLAVLAGGADGQESDYSRKGADTCLACHDDGATLAIFKTAHAVPTDSRGPFGHGQLQCESCHGPGAAHSGRVRRGQERPVIPLFGATSTASIEDKNAVCMACHKTEVGFDGHTGAHPSDEVACVDCHVSHAATDPVMQTPTQPEVCFDCHQQQRGETRKAFSHPFFQGKMDCSGCHSAHGDQAAAQLARQTVNATCEQCHAEKRGPYLWEHAPVSEDCGLCHAPHGSNHAGMLTKRAPLLCQSCHAQSGHPSIALGTDGLASAAPSQYLLGQGCMNCHSQVHGSNHPSGSKLQR